MRTRIIRQILYNEIHKMAKISKIWWKFSSDLCISKTDDDSLVRCEILLFSDWGRKFDTLNQLLFVQYFFSILILKTLVKCDKH